MAGDTIRADEPKIASAESAEDKRDRRRAEFERILSAMTRSSRFHVQLGLGLLLLVVGFGWATVEVIMTVISSR